MATFLVEIQEPIMSAATPLKIEEVEADEFMVPDQSAALIFYERVGGLPERRFIRAYAPRCWHSVREKKKDETTTA